MIYECIHHAYSITEEVKGKNGVAHTSSLRFTPDNKTGFGVFDTTLKHNYEPFGLEEKESDQALQKLIEGSELFKKCQTSVNSKQQGIGRVGIWRQQDRLTADQKKSATEGLKAGFGGLGEGILRKMIAAAGEEVPMDATKDQLISRLIRLQEAGKLGDVSDSPSEPAFEPQIAGGKVMMKDGKVIPPVKHTEPVKPVVKPVIKNPPTA